MFVKTTHAFQVCVKTQVKNVGTPGLQTTIKSQKLVVLPEVNIKLRQTSSKDPSSKFPTGGAGNWKESENMTITGKSQGDLTLEERLGRQ